MLTCIAVPKLEVNQRIERQEPAAHVVRPDAPTQAGGR